MSKKQETKPLQQHSVGRSCDCGDPTCEREIKGTSEGKLYVVNHFTCGKVKRQIEQLSKLKL
jgi:hypothetical protein